MAFCEIASQHAWRDVEQNNSRCVCVHCNGFCRCESNPDTPKKFEIDDEDMYAPYLHRLGVRRLPT
jgi:hypothetical protein